MKLLFVVVVVVLERVWVVPDQNLVELGSCVDLLSAHLVLLLLARGAIDAQQTADGLLMTQLQAVPSSVGDRLRELVTQCWAGDLKRRLRALHSWLKLFLIGV